MLVLTRKAEQSLLVGTDIEISVLSIEGDRVKLGIKAPRAVAVLRGELYEQVHRANTGAAQRETSDVTLTAIGRALSARRASATPAAEKPD